MNELTQFDTAYRAIMVAKNIDEVKMIRDKMEALRQYLKQQGESLEMQNACAEMKLRAERRAGELLKEMPKNEGSKGQLNGRDSSGGHAVLPPEDDTPTLADIGISKMQSSRFQAVASIPEDIFEAQIAETKASQEELTTKHLLRMANREMAKQEKVEAPEFPASKYRVVYADPPWKYGNTMPDYFTEQADYYPLMTVEEIAALPVRDITEENSVLFLWVTSPILEESFEVINAWGFKYKASFVWDKVKHVMGHYNSVRHELLLVCVKGSCQPDVKKLFDSVQTIERSGKHSEKPEEFRQIIDTIYPNGGRVELFARSKKDGWDIYGNESIPGFQANESPGERERIPGLGNGNAGKARGDHTPDLYQ